MSELLPSRQAAQIRSSLVDYLTTTFALSDEEAQRALREFLGDAEGGIFRGPYVRARVPFRAAADGWRDSLGWYEGHTPYGHQAEAFRRLSSANRGEQPDGSVKTAPQPTLVVTGTGSGKTEAFLYPILDHVLRAKAAGDTGVKALILYPMNALANDQSRRLAELIRGHDALKGVRAAIYTGETAGRSRTRVTADGLINDRGSIRSDPPDILLTNYKMLDQLLLRSADQPLLAAAASSLQYLVLDEFHTYDGAQGTDVAMLLRRLGLTLRRLRPENAPEPLGSGPLGDVTPIATSATLGDDGDPGRMLEFAETVFGIPFPADSVVRETRQSVRQWVRAARASGTPVGAPRGLDNSLVADIAALPGDIDGAPAGALAGRVLSALFADGADVDWASVSDDDLLASVASHDLVQAIATRAEKAVGIDDLADELLPAGLGVTETFESRSGARRVFLTRVLAALSHVRARLGRRALSIDLHMWIRELTRIDRATAPTARFHWADNGPVAAGADDTIDTKWFPAIFCRHCGRSGWGVQLAPVGNELSATDDDIRRDHAARDSKSRFRALLHAPSEADAALGGEPVPGLAWFDHEHRALLTSRPDDADEQGTALPVLALTSGEIDDDSRDDVCPACGRRDGIRFLGSAMATMLSVVVTTLFGDADLDRAEKKALVFTDSVQDAAHRAGFVQSRAHVFALRNAIRHAVADDATPLDEIANLLVQDAGDDADARYRLLPPDLVEREEFIEFWKSETLRGVPAAVLTRVKRRLQFDLAMEFGLQSRVGRTLELTGSLAASVSATEAALRAAGRKVLIDTPADGVIGGLDPASTSDDGVVRWVRGVLERMRDRGAIEHEWFTRYIEEDGKRWPIWGGRKRGVGMPAFPPGRDAPGYPRVGPHAPTGDDAHRTHLDVVSSAQSWYAIWARKVLGSAATDGVRLTAALLAELERIGILRSRQVSGGAATAYLIPPSSIVVRPVDSDALRSGDVRLECDVCRNPVTGTADAIGQLRDGPCISARCPGALGPVGGTPENYYRTLYDKGSVRRVVAREHTSLLDTKVRLDYENGFKSSSDDPSAPNVLVATPTLEMGIDIGDLSTVMLAGLPRSVASYLQRVGRAGRLTGNALSIATVTGRGDQLPRMGDPLSVINGAVRPPATFVDAQEILRRQYFASILDRRSAESDTVQKANDVLKTSEAGSFLGDAIAFADAGANEFVDAFLESFPTLGDAAATRLRDWATPTGEAGTSGLAASVRDAVLRWNLELQTVTRRRTEIGKALPDLEAAAELGVESDAKDAFRAAQAADRMLRAQQTALTDGYWIGALERFGLLPNYTLLDDSVRLDAAVSWIDPDTSEWHDDTYSYERGAAIAIHELAPGSYFYAQGLEIPVDAVDLGPGGEAVEDWTFCPECGFARRSADGPLTECPRCRSKGIGDAAQRMPVAELKTVSAVARRDEAVIGDRSDDRRRTAFAVKVGADLNPAGIVRRWYDKGTSFGVTYARDLTIRWINFGKRSGAGPSRFLAGSEVTGPLFRVCDTCGQLDSQAGGNSRRDHRPWCPRRDQSSEKTVALALARTLVTQGIFLRLPPALTLGDGVVVPSLSAAVLLGLRESMGGDPDHLRIVPVTEPLGDEGGTAQALLIHDTVPGGTGYLAELADPARLHGILIDAWRVLKDCPCQDEQRAACHRCLLPFAPGNANISRASAEQALAKLLEVSSTGDPSTAFDVTDVDPGVPLSESVIEQLFRKTFIERAQALGGRVKEIPGDWGNKVQVSFPGDSRIWMLRPQVPLGPTQPDFVLEQFGGGAEPIAIYTDGKAFHAVVGCNRLADDTKKRDAARGLGHRVVAVTWADLMGDKLDTSWFVPAWAEKVAAQAQLPLTQLAKLTADPVTLLMEWMQRPDDEAKRRDTVARVLPVILQRSATSTPFGGESALERAARVFVEGLPKSPIPAPDWVTAAGPLVSATRLKGGGATDFALVLDDRDEALADAGFDHAWRLWLHLSNVVGWRADMSGVEITTLSRLAAATPLSAAAPGVTPTGATELPSEWASLAAYATGAERHVIDRLAAASIPLPEMGVEVGGGIPISFAWADARVAISLDLQDGEADSLTSDGWTLLDPQSDDLAAQVAALTGGD
ncbi:DEAD/DEAH box helicase [Microbacterium aoyamense]|uniref:DEAD/DEAH box helicase n=1 Tax=Microbacterium aoyamense TaxID=344166 RepID=A0ABP5BG57_9MICO|nr:DEAD/DEAH box helicase [Microbacterium aoyamense]